MTRFRHAAIVAIMLCGAVLVPSASAVAAVTTLYVDNTSGTCSDTGTGTVSQPYCTIQAAANVVSAGQTVDINGYFYENVTISRSGTAATPITFDGGYLGGAEGIPALTISHAHDIVFSNLAIQGAGPDTDAIAVTASQRVTFANDSLSSGADDTTGAVVHIDGASANVTVTDSQFGQSFGADVLIDAGSSNDVIAGNQMGSGGNQGIVVHGATGPVIVNNSIEHVCNQGISLSGTVTGARVENNIIQYVFGPDVYYTCQAQVATIAALNVDATAAPGVVADYNDVYAYADTSTDYLWAGTSYATSAAFLAGTGQGAHDFDTLSGQGEGSPEIDSADAGVPGVPALDLYGDARVDDPFDVNTGVGPYSYLDRGAIESSDYFTTEGVTTSATQAPVNGYITVTGAYAEAWSEPFTCSYDFGDGHALTATACTTTHAYTAVGTYTITVTATNAAHLNLAMTATVTVVAAGGPLAPTLTNTQTGADAVTATVTAGTDPWNIASVTYKWGDGTTPQTTTNTSVYHVYPKPGTYTVMATVTDATGATKSLSHPFTTAGTNFIAYGPVRLLDTAHGIGTKTAIPAHTTVTLPIANKGTIPAGIAAAVVNFTAIKPAAAGTVTAWASGKARPVTTNVRFSAGLTTANESFVNVGSDGAIKIYNNSAYPLTLTADVVGYFTTKAAGDGFQTMDPTHLADTRSGLGTTAGQVKPGSPRTITVAGSGVIPASGVDAVALNVTTTGSTAAGTVSVYAHGTAAPAQSNVAFTAGRSVSNLAVVRVGADGKIAVSASSATDVVIDIAGYYSATGIFKYVPVTPVRSVDTAAGAGTPIAANTVGYFDVTNGIVNQSRYTGSVVGNMTVLAPKSAGQMTVFASTGAPAPNTYELQWSAGQSAANDVVTEVLSGLNGVAWESFYNDSAKPVNITFDTFGYFAATYY